MPTTIRQYGSIMTFSTQDLSISVQELALVDSKNPVLHVPTKAVEQNQIPNLTHTITQMHKLMLASGGIGLAAPQVGLDISVFVLNITGIDPLTCINPMVLEVSSNKVLAAEGCLSFPKLQINVERPERIKAAWFDHNGTAHTEYLEGLLCRAFLHEYDHLMGVCFTDRVSKLSLDMARKKLSKQQKRQGVK